MDTRKIPAEEIFKNVFLKHLTRDEGKNFQMDIVEVRPNSGIPQHSHPDNEWIYILEGSLTDENGTYQKGDFTIFPKDSIHTPISGEQGCTFIRCWCGKVELTHKQT